MFVQFMTLERAGHEGTLASSKGGLSKVDDLSLSDQWDPKGESRAFERTRRSTVIVRLADVKGQDSDAVLFVGGHGAMFDVAYDPEAHRILNEVYDSGGIVAAECHGSAEYFRSWISLNLRHGAMN